MIKERTGLTDVEIIKAESNYLRGSLIESLADSASGSLADPDTQLSKFHGFYQQDDRDHREDRRKRMLEPDFQFMIRARVPGGVCSPGQWLELDRIANEWANGSIRLTTRQAFQFHGVLKSDLKSSIRAINAAMLDTIAACGDVNRNVMCSPLPESSGLHGEVFRLASAVSDHLTPNTTAYHEIWLSDGESRSKVAATPDVEPIYGPTYLPRKFKMSFAIPPRNDVDVFAHDLSFVAIADNKGLQGFNIVVGGGMGATHGNPDTYPRLASELGFCTPQQVIEVSEAIVLIQRDHGDRGDRRHARLKYTIDQHGIEWLRDQVELRLGYQLPAPRSYRFTHNGDQFGWRQTSDGLWHLTLFIENGRIQDDAVAKQLSGMRAIAHVLKGEFRLTPNQNVIISGIDEDDRSRISKLVSTHGLDAYQKVSPLRLHSMACVGFPTCSLSMAESERYLPQLIDKIDDLLDQHGLSEQAITIRMTGCPNGCARPYLAEIGLVGKGPGLYNLHLGAAFNGSRLNTRVRESLAEDEILVLLERLFKSFRQNRNGDESFGDFLLRQKDFPFDEEHVVL
jgi:sulfite reductase (NADPH) hemoprotein beta-component